MKFLSFVIISLSLFLLPRSAAASCGAATCPLNNYRYIRAGWVGLNIVHEYINQDQVYVGSSKSFIGAIPEEHDEVSTLNQREVLRLQAGLSNAVGLNIDVTFVRREHSHIHHGPAGDELESWNFNGLGDAIVTANVVLVQPETEFAPLVTFVGGVKLPTGVTDAKNDAGEEAEVTIQPGTGSLDEIVGINYRQTLASLPMPSGEYGALPLIVGAAYQINGKGTNDYRVGNILLAHVGTAYQFTSYGSLLVQVNGKFQGYADVGTTGEPRENTGGSWVYLSPGIDVRLVGELSGMAYMQFPLYQNVHGIQQAAPYNLVFSLGYSFGLM